MVQVQATNTQGRVIPRVALEECRACHRCVARQSCRTKALVQVDLGEAPAVDAAHCYGCHSCVPACPFGAIVVR